MAANALVEPLLKGFSGCPGTADCGLGTINHHCCCRHHHDQLMKSTNDIALVAWLKDEGLLESYFIQVKKLGVLEKAVWSFKKKIKKELALDRRGH